MKFFPIFLTLMPALAPANPTLDHPQLGSRLASLPLEIIPRWVAFLPDHDIFTKGFVKKGKGFLLMTWHILRQNITNISNR